MRYLIVAAHPDYNHRCAKFGDDADLFMAAGGHYGNKSSNLVKHYVKDLGFDYEPIHNKEDAERAITYFLDKNAHDRPLIVEAFVNSEDENEALYALYHLIKDEPEYVEERKMSICSIYSLYLFMLLRGHENYKILRKMFAGNILVTYGNDFCF